MNTIVKKVVIYSMVGILQLGIGVSALEASPRHNDNHRDNQRNSHWQYRDAHDRQIREDRRREENERHEREMQRRHWESEREWRERERCENERHDNTLKDIETLAIIYLLFSR